MMNISKLEVTLASFAMGIGAAGVVSDIVTDDDITAAHYAFAFAAAVSTLAVFSTRALYGLWRKYSGADELEDQREMIQTHRQLIRDFHQSKPEVPQEDGSQPGVYDQAMQNRHEASHQWEDPYEQYIQMTLDKIVVGLQDNEKFDLGNRSYEDTHKKKYGPRDGPKGPFKV